MNKTSAQTRPARQYFGRSYGENPPAVYQRYFVPTIASPLAQDLIDVAGLRPGERVLDVACGTGVVARLAAARVGAGGTVVGIDVNPGMLAVARSATPPNLSIEWHEAPAEKLPLSDESFDVALCQLSLQFFQDRLAALREIRRILVPGGRLVANVPGPITPIFESLADGMSEHIDPDLGGFVRQVFSLPKAQVLQRLINEAGFSEAATQTKEKALRLPKPKDFLWQYVQSTPLSSAVARADDESRAALEHEVVEKWQDFVEGDTMIYKQDIVLAIARK